MAKSKFKFVLLDRLLFDIVSKCVPRVHVILYMLVALCIVCMNIELSPSQGLNLGLPNTSQMLLPLSLQDS